MKETALGCVELRECVASEQFGLECELRFWSLSTSAWIVIVEFRHKVPMRVFLDKVC